MALPQLSGVPPRQERTQAAGLPEPEWNAEIDTPFGVFHLNAHWRLRLLRFSVPQLRWDGYACGCELRAALGLCWSPSGEFPARWDSIRPRRAQREKASAVSR